MSDLSVSTGANVANVNAVDMIRKAVELLMPYGGKVELVAFLNLLEQSLSTDIAGDDRELIANYARGNQSRLERKVDRVYQGNIPSDNLLLPVYWNIKARIELWEALQYLSILCQGVLSQDFWQYLKWVMQPATDSVVYASRVEGTAYKGFCYTEPT